MKNPTPKQLTMKRPKQRSVVVPRHMIRPELKRCYPNIPRSMLRDKLREHLPEEVVDIITEDKGGHHG